MYKRFSISINYITPMSYLSSVYALVILRHTVLWVFTVIARFFAVIILPPFPIPVRRRAA